MRAPKERFELVHDFLSRVFGDDSHAKRILFLTNGTLGVMTGAALASTAKPPKLRLLLGPQSNMLRSCQRRRCDDTPFRGSKFRQQTLRETVLGVAGCVAVTQLRRPSFEDKILSALPA
jgi:hypothetical protein